MLKAFKSRMKWRTVNWGRMLSHRLGPPLEKDLQLIAETLRQDGIAICDVRLLLGDEVSLFDAVREETLDRRRSDMAHERAAELSGEKNFKVKLFDRDVDFERPLVRISLHPRVLALANHYMGMRSYLRVIDLWWDRPTTDPAAATQLWHRDFDDARCIKAFIYLNDVDADTGPFTYMPGTHMFGELADVVPGDGSKNRFSDAEMATAFDMQKAKIVTGQAGTVIFCDTYGFHRGVKPHKDRLMSSFQYVSRASKYPRDFHLSGAPAQLDIVQRQALEAFPAGGMHN